MRRRPRRPRKEGRRKSSIETFGKHCDGILLYQAPHWIMRQHQLTYLWQLLLTSNVCLAPYYFFKVFYKHFSYQKPWLLVSEKEMEEEDGTLRLVEEGSLIRLEGDPEIEYLGAEDLMLASTSSILTQPPTAASRSLPPQQQDTGLAKHVKLSCHRYCVTYNSY